MSAEGQNVPGEPRRETGDESANLLMGRLAKVGIEFSKGIIILAQLLVPALKKKDSPDEDVHA